MSKLPLTVKRIAAILILGLLLFNWVGYQLYTAILQDRADKSLIANLDENKYSDGDLISIKVPAAHISSYVNSKEFQRVDGQMEINGVQYNFVKRRYNDGMLELLCIPNKSVTRIQNARDNFFKLVNDLQHPGQSKKSDQHNTVFKSINAGNYIGMQAIVIPDLTPISLKAADHYLLQIPDIHLTRAGQPPDLA
jgi:hypothetical protein